jgi:hypothetical protein
MQHGLHRFAAAGCSGDGDRNGWPVLRYSFLDMDEKRELLRHALATLAYRAARALEGAPDHFAGFAGAGHLPVQILAHMGDLSDWALM